MVFTSKIIEKVNKHFASKNQLPGLSVNGTLAENGIIPDRTRKYGIKCKEKNKMLEIFTIFSINECRML